MPSTSPVRSQGERWDVQRPGWAAVSVDEVIDVIEEEDEATNRSDFGGCSSVPTGRSGASETYQTSTSAYPAAQPITTSEVIGGENSGVTGGKEEQVIPLAEEELQVGKRTGGRGTTSIRRYVVKKPVEESVTLRDETVIASKGNPR